MSRTWTEEQTRAIEETAGEILVSAAAGSGKTSVLVERIIRKLLDPNDPIGIDEILVVTFTEATAGEMKDRIRQALSQAATSGGEQSAIASRQLTLMGGANISTLHSFCLDIIRRYFFLIDLDPRFRVMDDEEADLLRRDVLDQLFESLHQVEKDEPISRLLAAYGGGRDDRDLKRIILSLQEYLHSLPRGEAWLEAAEQSYVPATDEWNRATRLWTESLMNDARISVENALSFLDQGIQLATLPNGPGSYLESFLPAREGLQSLLNTVEDGAWDEARQALSALTWPRIKSTKEADPGLIEEAQNAWNAAKRSVNQSLPKLFARSLDAELQDVADRAWIIREIAAITRTFSSMLHDEKMRMGAVDFADLERFALDILTQEDSPALKAYRQRFQEILVDEYQDINPVQDRLLAMVSRADTGGNRFMVGDVKQSIYRFRLADPKIFLDMQERFARPESKNLTRIDLSANFRSDPEVIAFVNFIFTQIMHPNVAEMAYDDKAALVAGKAPKSDPSNQRDLAPSVELHLIEASEKGPDTGSDSEEWDETATSDFGGDDEGDVTGGEDVLPDGRPATRHELEAVTAGRLIHRLISEGYRYKDIAIMLRSPKNIAATLQETLQLMGIPSYSHTGSGFYKAVEVELVLSLLRLINNPMEDIPLAGVLRSPIGGFDETDLATIRLSHRDGTFYEAVYHYMKNIEDPLSDRLRAFYRHLDGWRTFARRNPLSKLIHRIYEDTGYVDFVSALPAGERRVANLNELYTQAITFDHDASSGPEKFIAHVDQLAAAGKEIAPPPTLGEGEDVVSIMSVHKSKGLEFPVVIILDVDRKWSAMDTRGNILFQRDLGLGMTIVDREKRIAYPSLSHRALVSQIKRDALAEEMRLLYVALTRAEERLMVVSAVRDVASRAAKWAQSARETAPVLSQGVIAGARSWLDWIATAVCRHEDGEVLRALGAGDLGPSFYTPSEREVASTPLDMGVFVWMDGPPTPQAFTDVSLEPVDEGNGGQSAAREREDDANERVEQTWQKLKQLHDWHYPFERETRTPAKMSVTELVKYDDADDELTWRPMSVRPSPGVQKTDTVDPRLRGIAIHEFLAKINLKQLGESGSVQTVLAQMLDSMQQSGVISPEQVQVIDLGPIARFFQTDLGIKLIEAALRGSVWRELPFTMMPDGAPTIVQGMLDCLFHLNDEYVLIDYKTDRVRKGDEERIAHERYGSQVGYYMDFVKEVTGGSTATAFIVFLETGAIIRMESNKT